jgi:hypothetical protein
MYAPQLPHSVSSSAGGGVILVGMRGILSKISISNFPPLVENLAGMVNPLMTRFWKPCHQRVTRSQGAAVYFTRDDYFDITLW